MRAFPHFVPAFAVLLFAAGCGLDGPPPSETKSAPPAPQAAANPGATPKSDAKHADATPPGRPSHRVAETKPAVAAAEPQPSATSSAPAADTHPGTIRKEADVGMGEKGRGYGKTYIAVAAASLWSVKERLALDMIKHNLDLYKADHDGKGPKNHAEFMQKIIKEGDIKLPELPAGHTYEYDPAQEVLMVRMPEDPNGP